MTNRNNKQASAMKALENELFTRQQFLASLVKEAEVLGKKAQNGTATRKDEKRAAEILELARAHTMFINKNKERVRKYYAPATT